MGVLFATRRSPIQHLRIVHAQNDKRYRRLTLQLI